MNGNGHRSVNPAAEAIAYARRQAGRTAGSSKPADLRSVSLEFLIKLQPITPHAPGPNQDDRSQSVAKLKADLEPFLRGEAPRVSPETTWTRLRKTARKNKVLSAVVCVAALFVIVYLISVTVSL